MSKIIILDFSTSETHVFPYDINIYESYEDLDDYGQVWDTRISIINLPQPSKAFIEKYCKLGGIDEVMIEYEERQEFESADDYTYGCGIEPKVNSHNEITIHPIKNSWNREEVEKLIINAFEAGYQSRKNESEGVFILDVDDWIKKKSITTMRLIKIYTVNNKAVNIIQKHNHTYLVQFIKSGKYSSVHKKYVKYFTKQYKTKTNNQLKLTL